MIVGKAVTSMMALMTHQPKKQTKCQISNILIDFVVLQICLSIDHLKSLYLFNM